MSKLKTFRTKKHGVFHANGHTTSVDAQGFVPEGYRPSEALFVYLEQIGKVKLLTPTQEIQLAALIKKGDARAREHMIKANLRFVVKIARDYEGLGLSLLDLINEGNIGLMKAVERFDPLKGGKLSTYSSFWIKQSIRRALSNQSKTIRLPVHLVDKISNMRKVAMRLQEVLGREPTSEELAEEIGVHPEKINLLRQASQDTVHLDTPIGEDDNGTVADIVADPNAITASEAFEGNDMRGKLKELIRECLDQREHRIISLRFGLNNEETLTLDEVGKILGITRERVRQIQNKALRKMRERHEWNEQRTLVRVSSV